MKTYLFVRWDALLETGDGKEDPSAFPLRQRVLFALDELQRFAYQLVLLPPFRQNRDASFLGLLKNILSSQGISCEDQTRATDDLYRTMLPYLRRVDWDRPRSFLVSPEAEDSLAARDLGLGFYPLAGKAWSDLSQFLIRGDRKGSVFRQTHETKISVQINLDRNEPQLYATGLGFLDHMLEQIGRHAGISLQVESEGDLHVDEHHSIEDCALSLGACLDQALGERRGIGRYGFQLPMDEAQARVLIDLGGRSYLQWKLNFRQARIGGIAVEMFPHFFRSLADALRASVHIEAEGENDHHVIEAVFKAFARALKQAIKREGAELPSSKGCL